MDKTKLWKLLASFDGAALDLCTRFVRCDYFNASGQLVVLFDACVKTIKKSKTPSKQLLWAAVFGLKPFNDVRFRKLTSDLTRVLERFLALERFESDEILQASLLLDNIRFRNITELNDSAYAAVQKLMADSPFRSSRHYYNKYWTEDIRYELSGFETQHMAKSNVEDIINNLDRFYLSEKLRLYCTVLSRSNIISHDYQLLFIDEIISHVESNNYSGIAAVHLYWLVLRTLRSPDNEQFFHELVAYISLHDDEFPNKELYHIYGQALNCCVRFINMGKTEYLHIYVQLFETLLDRDLVFDPNHKDLSPWRFTNTVAVYNRLERFADSEKFIQTYKHRLPKAFAENAVTYNLAIAYFYQKRFDEVLGLLQTVEYDDVTYNLGSKAILLATYYETNEFEVLLNQLDTFLSYLVRHKDLNKDRRVNYKNYVRFLRKLVNTQTHEQAKLIKLRAEVMNEPMASKKWLLDKIDDKIKKHPQARAGL